MKLQWLKYKISSIIFFKHNPLIKETYFQEIPLYMGIFEYHPYDRLRYNFDLKQGFEG